MRASYNMFNFYRNNVNVEGATHKQVVDLIKSGGDTLTLTGTCQNESKMHFVIVFTVISRKQVTRWGIT